MRRCARWLVLLLLAASGGCREGGYSWEAYTSDEGRFRVLLPGTPVVKTIHQKSAAGTFHEHAVVAALKNGDFLASFTDLPSKPRYDLTTTIKVRAELQGGKVVDEREMVVAGHKGRSYEIEVERPHQFHSGRLVVVDGRLYHLMVTGPALRASAPEVKKFFDSFQLLP